MKRCHDNMRSGLTECDGSKSADSSRTLSHMLDPRYMGDEMYQKILVISYN